MEEKILNEILKETFTLDSFRKRFQLLKFILEKEIYYPQAQKAEEAAGTVPVAKSEAKGDVEVRESKWLAGFDRGLIKGMDSNMYSLFTQRVEKFIETIKPLTIYFVFVPDETQIKAFGTWLRENLDQPRLVFDFKVDPTLIGGCAFVYKGIYKDYSLRARISDNKDKIIGEFRKYFKQ